jgi:hypothetical protein
MLGAAFSVYETGTLLTFDRAEFSVVKFSTFLIMLN